MCIWFVRVLSIRKEIERRGIFGISLGVVSTMDEKERETMGNGKVDKAIIRICGVDYCFGQRNGQKRTNEEEASARLKERKGSSSVCVDD